MKSMKNMKKIMAGLAAFSMAAGLMMGCGSSSAQTSTTAAASEDETEADEAGEDVASDDAEAVADGELQDFEIILDWYPNAIHSFLYVAQEKGYFAEEGLNVTLTAPAGYSDGITFPAAGKAEAGLYYMPDACVGYADEGMDIEILGAVTQDSLGCMIALKESNILSPADFAGKKVGYSGGETLKAKLITVAELCGVSEDDFELVDIGFDIENSLVTGAVDVVAGGMLNNEVVELRNAGYDIDYWTLDEYGTPREYEILVVVNKTAYEADPDLYEGFLAACRKAFDDVKADPEAALDILFEHEDAENYALDRDMETESLSVLLELEENSGAEFMSMEASVWEEEMNWLHENGILENVVDPAEFVHVEE